MSTYDQLMVYKYVYDLTQQSLYITKRMDKGYKFTLGEKLNDTCLDLLICIYRINSSTERNDLFVKSREQIEKIRLLLRLIRDMRLITIARFNELNECVVIVSKQLTGWHNSIKPNNNPSKAKQQNLF